MDAGGRCLCVTASARVADDGRPGLDNWLDCKFSGAFVKAAAPALGTSLDSNGLAANWDGRVTADHWLDKAWVTFFAGPSHIDFLLFFTSSVALDTSFCYGILACLHVCRAQHCKSAVLLYRFVGVFGFNQQPLKIDLWGVVFWFQASKPSWTKLTKRDGCLSLRDCG
jgi:hypothetical protein